MMGMQVQADAIRRAQEMGLMPPGMPQPGMAPMGMPQWPQQAGHVGPAQADCVSASVARFRSVTGRYPTPAEEQPILLQCQ